MASIAPFPSNEGDIFYQYGAAAMDSGGGAPSLLVRYLRVLTRWWLPIAIVLALSLAAGLVSYYLVTPQYTATAVIQIARDTQNVVGVKSLERETSMNDLEFYQTQYGLLKSRSLAERVATKLKLDRDASFFTENGAVYPLQGTPADLRDIRLRAASGIVLRNLAVSPVRSSRLVNLSYTGTNRSRAADIVNGWAVGFIDQTIDSRFNSTSFAKTYLEDRLAELKIKLEDAERQMVSYAADQQLISIGSQQDDKGQRTGNRSIAEEDLANVNGELSKASSERIAAQSRLNTSGRGSNSAEILSNAAITSLRQKRAEVASDYAKLMVQFEPEYPPARALRQQMDVLDRSISAEENRVHGSIRNAYDEAYAREAELSRKVTTLKSQLVDNQRRSIQYNIYQRDVDTTRELYNGLLQRYKEIGVAGGVGANNISIVDKAMVPSSPSNPKLFVNLLMALLAGTLLSGAAVFLLEQLVDSITDPDDLKRDLNIPLLGTIPMTHDIEPLVALTDPKSDLVEAYFSAQTNLQFATDHGIPRSLMVTSTRPAEGKSTSSYALAQTIVRSGKKVILIDGDLRSPSLHHMLGWKNDKGLSNYLSGSDDLGELLRPVGTTGMVVMVGGPVPPNAAELLSGTRIDHLIERLKKEFDVIVFDAPPVMGLADAPLLASKVEGTVFTVESNGTRKRSVRVALDRLRAANARIVGGLLTKFESKRAYYGYGYEYGYGYGGARKDQPQA